MLRLRNALTLSAHIFLILDCFLFGLIFVVRRVALYQASISSLCDRTYMSVGLSVRKVYCGKTAEWIRIQFGMVSGVSRGMGVLDGVVIVEGKGQFLG